VGEVSVSPAEVYTDTDVTCLVNGIVDAEEDAVDLEFAWYLDGELLDGATGQVLGSDNFVRGHLLSCGVVPFDTWEAGEEVESPAVEVLNSLPTAPTVAIQPADPWDEADLHCVVIQESEDADADAVEYLYQWQKDGVPQPGLEGGTTISSVLTTPCEEWQCTVTPVDETDAAGEPGLAVDYVAPVEEVCDGEDNNCDGHVDEVCLDSGVLSTASGGMHVAWPAAEGFLVIGGTVTGTAATGWGEVQWGLAPAAAGGE